MKLATYIDDSGLERIGTVINDDAEILDIQSAYCASGHAPNPAFRSMQHLIEAGSDALETIRQLKEKPAKEHIRLLTSVSLLAPIPRPIAMRDFLTFEAHVSNALNTGLKVGIFSGARASVPDVWYQAPRYYKCNCLNIVGDGSVVRWPSYSERMDFELELGWVIGKRGKNIRPEDAIDHLFGFTIYNDLTARDALFSEMAARLGPAKGKDFDAGNVLGPWIVTMDEIGDPHNLEMVAHVNGEEWSRGNSGQAYHKIEDCIAYASREETLHPGEIFGSGTVGTGSGIEHDRWLQDEDIVVLTVEKIGSLTTQLRGPSARPFAETRETNVQFG